MRVMLSQRHPPGKLCAIDDRYAIDNGAMIAWTGYLQVPPLSTFVFIAFLRFACIVYERWSPVDGGGGEGGRDSALSNRCCLRRVEGLTLRIT